MGYESSEDQIASGIGNVLEAAELDLLFGGEAVNLVKLTGRIDVRHDAAEREELARDEDVDTSPTYLYFLLFHAVILSF